MQVKTTEHRHLLSIDDVEQTIRKTPEHSPAHVAVESLVERRVDSEMPLDPGELVEEFTPKPWRAVSYAM